MPYIIFSVYFQAIEPLPIVCQLDPKILQAFMGFFLFAWNKFLLRHFRVVVYRARQ